MLNLLKYHKENLHLHNWWIHLQVPQKLYNFDPLKDQSTAFTCSHCDTSFKVSSALCRHIELWHCSKYDPGKHRALQCGLDTRILQAVRDLMPSTILQNPELLRLMNHQCILCRQDFKRRNELVRHVTQQHASLFQETRGVAASMADLCRGPQFTCFCLPPRDRPSQRSKHQCVVFTQGSRFANGIEGFSVPMENVAGTGLVSYHVQVDDG